jgi:hypothetical protein
MREFTLKKVKGYMFKNKTASNEPYIIEQFYYPEMYTLFWVE